MRLQTMVRMYVACCAWLLPMQALLAQAPGERLSGEVLNLDDGKLTIKTADEPLAIVLADNARVTIRAPADLSRLDRGQCVGVTAAPQPDGTLVASQINVFPESMRCAVRVARSTTATSPSRATHHMHSCAQRCASASF